MSAAFTNYINYIIKRKINKHKDLEIWIGKVSREYEGHT